MNRFKLAMSLASLALAATVLASQRDEQPKRKPAARDPMPIVLRIPPEFATVTRVDEENGTLHLRKIVMSATTKEITVTVNRDGRAVSEKRQVMEQVPLLQNVQLEMAKFRFINGKGEKVGIRDAFKKLAVGKVILLSWDINGVEESIRKVLAPDALILMSREAGPAEAPPTPRDKDKDSDR